MAEPAVIRETWKQETVEDASGLGKALQAEAAQIWLFQYPPELNVENFNKQRWKIPAEPAAEMTVLFEFQLDGQKYGLLEEPMSNETSMIVGIPGEDREMRLGEKAVQRQFKVVLL